MVSYPRQLQLSSLIKHRSLFLFGPRQTGKTTFLREHFPHAKFFDLLESDTFRELSARPEIIRTTLREQDEIVVIDEIQRLPGLLNEVHLLIERNKKLRFIMTGSSARKLKRGAANLLAGRALIARFHPLVAPELDFERIEDRLVRGSLPSVIDSEIPFEDLSSYVGTYLREEVQAEGLSRSIEDFSRFLELAATTNGELLNFTSLGNDAAISPRTVQNYYQILEDTLVGHILKPFQKTKKRKAVATSKFYFFDIGVLNTLLGREQIAPRGEAYGRVLEHLIFLELRAYADYRRVRSELSFWRSLAKQEVDFLVGDKTAIEVKAKERVSNADLKGLRALSEELRLKYKIVVCNEKWPRKTEDGIEIIGVQEFLRRLWQDEFV